MRFFPTTRKPPQIAQSQKCYDALHFIKSNYHQDITLQDIANAVNYTPTYIAKLFKIVVGVTPTQYLTLYRIQKACDALQMTSDSVEKIAYDCGFQSLRTFHQAFQKVCSCSPLNYRRNMQK